MGNSLGSSNLPQPEIARILLHGLTKVHHRQGNSPLLQSAVHKFIHNTGRSRQEDGTDGISKKVAQAPVDQLYICRFSPAIYSPHERLQKLVGQIQYSGDMRTNSRITCIWLSGYHSCSFSLSLCPHDLLLTFLLGPLHNKLSSLRLLLC